MKFTISDCILRINQALNYPALSYEDVSHFFDQAIAELNTSLRISLPTVTEMRAENTFNIYEHPNAIPLAAAPTEAMQIHSGTTAPSDGSIVWYYVDEDSYLKNTFRIFKNDAWKDAETVYGIVSAGSAYQAIPIGNTFAVWKPVEYSQVAEFSLTDYLTTDWIILFLIPYVCFKFSVRNGDNGAIFADEFTQGFQQLQTSYSVPNEVVLSTVSHLPVYKDLTRNNLANLNAKVRTRAITDSMKINNGVRAIYGNTLFEKGGWGI